MPTIDQPKRRGPLIQRAIQRSASTPIRKLLVDPEAFATSLLVVVLDHYGTEVLQWAPQTIRLELEEDFQISALPLNFDKLMAAITIVTTDFYYRDLYRFIVLTNALVGSGFTFHEFDKADVHECAWAITEAWLLNPPSNPQPFCDAIRHYLSILLLDEGYMTPPGMLKMAINGDRSAGVSMNHGDDHQLMGQIGLAQQEKTQAVNDMVEQNLQELLSQMQNLPLTSGNSKNVAQALVNELKKIRA